MYGGKIDSTGNVSSQLWVFHIQNQTWVLLNPRAKEQYAVVGHSAHIVPPVQEGVSPIMLVLFGHCPLYGYSSHVQEYNIGKLWMLSVVNRELQFSHCVSEQSNQPLAAPFALTNI